jgi:hypothetical protein
MAGQVPFTDLKQQINPDQKSQCFKVSYLERIMERVHLRLWHLHDIMYMGAQVT